MSHQNLKFESLLAGTNVIPVMVIKDIAQAVPLARELVKSGMKVLEITLRTDCALAAIKEIIAHVPEAVVGVGTVTTPQQLRDAQAAGATFAVSPGSTDDLIAAADETGLPLLPGVATASEAMKLQALGYRYLKLFPAEAVGGRALLKSLQGPLPDLKFCPTGGITSDSAADYLALGNVVCVGGSWMI
ncbi:bifunctional 4-hydroxy-2-oxoglutarate aldolase/2-dehydro-3-deoxy-phosphogluconate aldolase [Paremcibacter congregatus]|uniref:bifunctional 4-hydroxy-2-oxoglutarate aldolase/2-dehydro-3-deoxy-phosphogluconate aldolase n=1 Tax=Paremcibacter congregatus TaxID=2043170 RepID=UPI003A8DEC61